MLRRTLLASPLALATLPAAAQAPAWPDRPTRWMVAYGAGGASDLFARMIAVADHLLNSAQANTAGMLALATGLLTDYGPWMRTLAESHPATLGNANDLAFPTHTQRFDVFAA